jgi:GxxExxY protein
MPEPSVETDRIARQIVDSAITVHRALGPGLLESLYEHCLCHELRLREIPTDSQIVLPVVYKGLRVDAGYRMDLVVAERIVVEIKAVEQLLPIHEAQLLTYLKLSGIELGLLINFNAKLVKDGIKRLILSR